MRLLPRRSERVPHDVLERAGLPRRTRVLASGRATDGTWLLGLADRLVLVGGHDARSLTWDEVQAADWDDESGRLRVTEVGSFGEVRPRHDFFLEDQSLLLQLVRERVQSSVVLQRKVAVRKKRGFTVIGRRRADGSIAWMVEYDAGIDPDDAEVRTRVDDALAVARNDVGE
jgi:hypothetical protein